MDCLVWASEQARSIPADGTESEDGTDSDGDGGTPEEEEGILRGNEKEALRSLSLDTPLVRSPETGDAPADESISRDGTGAGEEVTDSTSPDVLTVLRDSLDKSRRDSLRHRQLHQMLQEQERSRAMRQDLARQQRQCKIAELRDAGVSTQSAELLPMDPFEETPLPILRELGRIETEKRTLERQRFREKCHEVFASHWVRETEKELVDCAKILHTEIDDSTRTSMESLLDILQDKLKTHHKNLGTLGTEEALAERRRTCIEMGMLRERHAHLVKCVYQVLPSEEEKGESPPPREPRAEIVQEDDDDDEDAIFVTPIPSWEISRTALERTRRLGQQRSPSCGGQKRTRQRSRHSEKRPRTCTNSITTYFPSQK